MKTVLHFLFSDLAQPNGRWIIVVQVSIVTSMLSSLVFFDPFADGWLPLYFQMAPYVLAFLSLSLSEIPKPIALGFSTVLCLVTIPSYIEVSAHALEIPLAGIVAVGAAVGLPIHVLGVGATVGYLIHLLMVVLTVLTAARFMKPENYTPQFKLFSWPDISLLVWVPIEFLGGVLLGIVFIGIWAVMIFALSTSY